MPVEFVGSFSGQDVVSPGFIVRFTIALITFIAVDEQLGKFPDIFDCLTFSGGVGRRKDPDNAGLGTFYSYLGGFYIISPPNDEFHIVGTASAGKGGEQRIFILGHGNDSRQFFRRYDLTAAADNSGEFKMTIFSFDVGGISDTGQCQLFRNLGGHLGRVAIDRLHTGDDKIVLCIA